MSEVMALPPDAELPPQAITARSGSNFLAGFVCLDAERRDAMTAIYAFCRVVDDAADDAPDVHVGRQRLRFWQEELAQADAGTPRTPVGAALQQAMRRFGVPRAPLGELVAGCAMDLEADGIPDEATLRLYCRRVASAVGLACLPVFGATSAGAQRYADALGEALQLTNILRDLRSDAEVGRIYAPSAWLDEFGIQPEWLLGTGPSDVYVGGGPVVRLCERLADRSAARFTAAREELRCLPRHERRALVPARIMGAVYGEVLRRLVRRGGVLVLPRARVPRAQKLWLALQVWAGLRA